MCFFSPFDCGLKYGLDRFLIRFTHKAMHCIVHNLVFRTARPSSDPPSGLSIDLCDLMTMPDLLSRGKKWLSWGSLAYLHAYTSSAINQLISPGCSLVDGHWLRDNRGPLDRERRLSELVKDSTPPPRPLFINKCCSVTVYTQQRGSPICLERAWRMIWPVQTAVTLHTVVILCVDSKAFQCGFLTCHAWARKAIHSNGPIRL